MTTVFRRVHAFCLSVLAVVSGCQTNTSSDDEVLVLAAASTGVTIRKLATDFTAETGCTVRVSVGPSNALAAQVVAGAPADLFLSANQHWADELERQKLIDQQTPLVGNSLVFVVHRSIEFDAEPTVESLLSAERLAIAGPATPLGIYSQQAITNLLGDHSWGQSGRIVWGGDAITTCSYVARGEVDVAIVYASTAVANSDVQIALEIPADSHQSIRYPLLRLVPTTMRHNRHAVERFEAFLLDSESANVFVRDGFQRVSE